MSPARLEVCVGGASLLARLPASESLASRGAVKIDGEVGASAVVVEQGRDPGWPDSQIFPLGKPEQSSCFTFCRQKSSNNHRNV